MLVFIDEVLGSAPKVAPDRRRVHRGGRVAQLLKIGREWIAMVSIE